MNSIDMKRHASLANRTLGAALARDNRPFAMRMVNELGNEEGSKVFLGAEHRQVYGAIFDLLRSGKPIDAASVKDLCRKSGDELRNGSLDPILAQTPFIASAPDALKELLNQWKSRETEKALKEMVAIVRSGDAPSPEQVLGAFHHRMRGICQVGGEQRSREAEDFVYRAHQYQQVLDQGDPIGIKWGVDSIDAYSRLEPGGFYVVGGLSKSGKSKFATYVAHQAAASGVPVLHFSLEMGESFIWDWYVSRHEKVDSAVIGTPKMDQGLVQRLQDKTHEIYTLPLTINDEASIDVDRVSLAVKEWKLNHGHEDGLVVIDYLQLMTLPNGKLTTEASQLKAAAYALARLAQEEKLPILVLAQLNRQAESARYAGVEHLEGSGGILQAARAAIVLDNVCRRLGSQETDLPSDCVPLIFQCVQRSGKSWRGKIVGDMTTGGFRSWEDSLPGGLPTKEEEVLAQVLSEADF